MEKLAAVIMAGGQGTRLWPFSRSARPKQLLSLTGSSPMVLTTTNWLESFIDSQRIFVVTNKTLVEQMSVILENIPQNHIIGEPIAKSTAPCVVLAAYLISEEFGEDTVNLVLSADSYVKKSDKFLSVLKYAAEYAAKEDCLVTVSHTPTRPETGYGYMELGDELLDIDNATIFKVRRFTEKPDEYTAQQFVASGNYVWNCGIFAWKSKYILKAIEQYKPDLYASILKFGEVLKKQGLAVALNEYYQEVSSTSIDYAIMEHAKNIVTVRCDVEWDDVGSWQFLERTRIPDEDGNIILSDHIGIETSDCIILSDTGVAATYGIKDLIIIRAGDAILICHRSKAAYMKNLLSKMKENDSLKKYL